VASLSAQSERVEVVSQQIAEICDQLETIETIPRTLIAELALLRVFSLFEIFVEDCACRLVCGASYCDSSEPTLLRQRPTAGIERAKNEMRRYDRADPHMLLRWNSAVEVRKNLERLFPEDEHFVSSLVAHERLISDIRKIRNHVAHGNRGTRTRFNDVIRNYYGADVNSITPGKMLISQRFNPPLLKTFTAKLRIIMLESIRCDT